MKLPKRLIEKIRVGYNWFEAQRQNIDFVRRCLGRPCEDKPRVVINDGDRKITIEEK